MGAVDPDTLKNGNVLRWNKTPVSFCEYLTIKEL